MSEEFDDLPPPPPLEDDFLPTNTRYNSKKNPPPAPPRKNAVKKGGPPPVIPRTIDARKSSIAIRNNLLFRMSRTPIGVDKLPPAPPTTKQQPPPRNQVSDRKEDSAVYSVYTQEKPKIDIKVKDKMPIVTLKSPEQKIFDGMATEDIKSAFNIAPAPASSSTPEDKKLLEPPNYSEYDCKLFEAINQVRTKPSSFIPLLEERISRFEEGTNNLVTGQNSRLVTQEGAAGVQEAIEFLRTQEAANHLSWHNTLAEVCREHVEEIGAAGLYAHKMKDGTQPTDKIMERLAQKVSTAAESIKFSSDDALTAVIDFIVDDGVESRGNRSNLFGNFDLVGCFTGPHSISETMTTLLFVQNASTSSNILQTLLGKINEQVQDPPNWAQKQQKVLFDGDEITVTNLFLMKDGSQNTVEIKRKVKNNQLI